VTRLRRIGLGEIGAEVTSTGLVARKSARHDGTSDDQEIGVLGRLCIVDDRRLEALELGDRLF